jgi:hypothetical protein
MALWLMPDGTRILVAGPGVLVPNFDDSVTQIIFSTEAEWEQERKSNRPNKNPFDR